MKQQSAVDPTGAGRRAAALSRLHAGPAGVRCGHDGLREQLEVARQQAEVAVSVIGVLKDFVDPEDDRLLVVADIVRQWRQLSPAVQAAYRPSRTFVSAIADFAWDYVDGVTEAVSVSGTSADDEHSNHEGAPLRHWDRHVELLRDGQRPRLARQQVLVGDHEFAIIRAATEEERQRFGLGPGDHLLELWPARDEAHVYPAQELVFRTQQAHNRSTNDQVFVHRRLT